MSTIFLLKSIYCAILAPSTTYAHWAACPALIHTAAAACVDFDLTHFFVEPMILDTVVQKLRSPVVNRKCVFFRTTPVQRVSTCLSVRVFVRHTAGCIVYRNGRAKHQTINTRDSSFLTEYETVTFMFRKSLICNKYWMEEGVEKWRFHTTKRLSQNVLKHDCNLECLVQL